MTLLGHWYLDEQDVRMLILTVWVHEDAKLNLQKCVLIEVDNEVVCGFIMGAGVWRKYARSSLPEDLGRCMWAGSSYSANVIFSVDS